MTLKLITDLYILTSPILFVLTALILGLFQPGYDHIRYTVSRLAIGEYGWIQNFNFLQLAGALLLLSSRLAGKAPDARTRRSFRTAFGVAAAALILSAVFPTDPSESRFILAKFTPNGAMHVGVVIGFLILSPYMFRNLARAFTVTPGLEKLGKMTLFMGYTALLASAAWLAYYPFGIMIGNLGLFQKMIITWVLGWITLVAFYQTYHNQ